MMRTLSALLLGLAVSVHAMAGESELLKAFDLIRRIDEVNPMGGRAARDLLWCSRNAAKAVGEADKVTPAMLVGESMGREALARCPDKLKFAMRVLTEQQFTDVSAQMVRLNAEVALDVRREPRVIVCANLHPCGTPLKR
jgi:hypothetical protein